jgi:hypothetical protein
MAMPEAPPGEDQALLQTIWDLAYAGLTWPTFAELDRRWDSRHDSDVIGVLRQIPAGFITGFDARTEPQNSTKIGLTVAGAAACQNSQEVLAIFLDFIRVAAATERAWSPTSDEPDARPTLTDQEYAKQARNLPAADRSDLLRMVFQLVKTEPCGWVGLGGPDAEGHWTVTLDRGVRSFRGLVDLDDYWSRRHKSWEPAQPESAAAPAEPAPADPHLTLLEAHPDILGPMLLAWIYTKAGSSTTEIIVVSDFEPEVSPAKAEEALRRLQSQGLVRLHWLDPAPSLPRAQLTANGAELAVLTTRDWDSAVLRDRTARNALLAWIRDQRDSPQGMALVANFLRDRRSSFSGRFFSASDVDAAAAYLYDKGLIDGTFVDQQHGPVYARLKAEGIDCIEHGGDVAAYLTSKERHPVTYNFNAPVSGTNVAVGDHATQISVTQGIDADALRTLVQAITEALPALGLDSKEQIETEEVASGIVTETQQSSPDRSRLRQGLGSLGRLVASSAQQALAAVLSALIDYELAKLGLPPGS